MRYTLPLDPRKPGQDDKLHLWALRDRPELDGPSDTGLAFVHRPCEPGAITLGVVPLDARWHELEWDDQTTHLVLRGDDGEHHEALQWMRLNLADGHLTPETPEAEALASRLRPHLRGVLLDLLAAVDADRRDPDRQVLMSRLPARISDSNQLIAWSEAFPAARRDEYLLADGTRVTAQALFCPNMECPCERLTVEFFDRPPRTGEPTFLGTVEAEYGARQETLFYVSQAHAERLQAAWDAFRSRYPDLLGFKHRAHELKKWAQPHFRGLERGRRVAARPNRNAPCPCGSGQKYKKCCWARDAAAELGPVPQ